MVFPLCVPSCIYCQHTLHSFASFVQSYHRVFLSIVSFLFSSADLKSFSNLVWIWWLFTCVSRRWLNLFLMDGIFDVALLSTGGAWSSLFLISSPCSVISIHSHLWSLGDASCVVYPPCVILRSDDTNILPIVFVPP